MIKVLIFLLKNSGFFQKERQEIRTGIVSVFFEAAALIRIDRDDVIEVFRRGRTDFNAPVAKHQVKIITSDISFEHDGIGNH